MHDAIGVAHPDNLGDGPCHCSCTLAVESPSDNLVEELHHEKLHRRVTGRGRTTCRGGLGPTDPSPCGPCGLPETEDFSPDLVRVDPELVEDWLLVIEAAGATTDVGAGIYWGILVR